MNSRFLISALCVGAVAFACGPRPRNDAAATSRTTTLAAAQFVVAPQGTSRATPAATGNATRKTKDPVAAELYVRATSESVRLALVVMNTSKKRVELSFPSGQTYEFVILDSLDREVWRWGRGRMFTQAVRNRLLSAGQALEFEETWEHASLPPGRYVARAKLTSDSHPLGKQAEFTVDGATIASR